MEAFRKAGDLVFDLLLSRSANIKTVNMSVLMGFSFLAAYASIPTYNTEIGPVPILELSDAEEVIILPQAISDEELYQRSLQECDDTREKYAQKCAETEDNKVCNIWLYHAKRCNRWRHPPPPPAVTEEKPEEFEEIADDEIAMIYGFSPYSSNVDW